MKQTLIKRIATPLALAGALIFAGQKLNESSELESQVKQETQLAKINSATSTTTIQIEKQAQESKQEQDSKEKYKPIISRYKQSTGVRTVHNRFYIESNFWENLEKGLSKEQFYDKVKDASFQSIIEPVFTGVPVIHPGPINHEDIIDEFMTAADAFIKSTKGNKCYELEPELKFTKQDKQNLKELLEENIKSDLIGEIDPINPFARKRQVYTFPAKSKIIITKDKTTTISIQTNLNPDTEQEPRYAETRTYEINTPERKAMFDKMLKLSLLAVDSRAEESGYIPINELFKKYQER